MSYRILHALKRLTVSAVLRFLPARRVRPETPTPRRRDFDARQPVQAADDWLFGEVVSPLAMEVDALSRELGRTSRALEGLREMLSDISTRAPIEVSAGDGASANTLWSEDLLFDGEPMAVVPSLSEPLAGEAMFLFEDEERRTGWSALEGLRAEPPRAA